jgi:8-oxo-dGTP diphosphatase
LSIGETHDSRKTSNIVIDYRETIMPNHCYDYPRPALTADIIALRWKRNQLEVLMIRRAHEPFQGELALPGGFVDQNETPLEAAARECMEETGVMTQADHLIEVGCFGNKDRDPRGWTVSVAFIAFLSSQTEASAQDDAKEVQWIPWHSLIKGEHTLAFDHAKIVIKAHETLKMYSLTTPALLNVLETPFRSRQVRFLYRQLWGDQLSPRSFKAWLRRVDLVERVGRALFQAKSHLRLPW